MSKLTAAKIYIICISLLVHVGVLGAYELATHGQLTQQAFERSAELRRYLEALSIKDADIFDVITVTPSGKLGDFFDNTGTTKHWMMEGSVREDDFSTALPTLLNH